MQQKGPAGDRAGALTLGSRGKPGLRFRKLPWPEQDLGRAEDLAGAGLGPPGQPDPGAQVDSVTPWRENSPGYVPLSGCGLKPGPDMELIN